VTAGAGNAVLPPAPARVHFVGIGGIGMSGLARILGAWGYAVSGSDAIASELTDALAAEGVPVAIGHGETARAAGADLVVATAAARPDNPELAAARAAGVPVVKRAELLGLLANARRNVAVAGTHGKSTTTGLLVAALRVLGDDPSYAIGAVLAATGTNAAPGTGAAMVVEADEYDLSFLHLTPDVAIVTNVEYDHPDLFPDQTAYDRAFARFAAGVRPGGTLVLAADDPGCRRLRETVAGTTRVVTFGQAGEPDWTLVRAGDGWAATGPDGATVPLPLTIPGEHNARNAVAALAALVALGHGAGRAAAALVAFTGVGRRFETKGEAAGVTVVDDYAHHPSEVRATLRAARERFPDRRLWAVFQPHTYSRTRALLAEFAAAFADADRVAVLEVYAARETDTLGVGAHHLVGLLPAGSLYAQGPRDAAARLARLVEPGDVVLTLGAGDVTATGPHLLALLAEQTAATGAPR
jgi:UDP-N-acetylmuramate--alanine ligase